jgi:hypothetical protein
MKRSRTNRVLPEPDFLPDEKGHFRPDYIRQVFFMSLLGATDVQMAQVFGVASNTLEMWKKTKPDFLESMRKGKIIADSNVSNSLYLAAVGYSHPDEVIVPNRIKEFQDGKLVSEHTEIIRVKTIKNYPPNVAAAVKWLSSRQPDLWGHKLEIKGKVAHTHKLDLSMFNMTELKTLAKIGIGTTAEDTEYENVE